MTAGPPEPRGEASRTELRRARGDEAEALRQLTVRSMAHLELGDDDLAAAAELLSLEAEDIERDETWVAEQGGSVIGYYRVAVDGERAEIEELFVEPEWIGRGFGRRLFRHAADRAGARGARRLEWTTDRHALGFYLAMGGSRVGTRPAGIGSDEPLSRMSLVLRP